MNLKDTNDNISSLYDAMKDMQLYKNSKYGNVASEPLNIFARYMSKDSTELNGIYQRLDDKLSRIKNCDESRPRINDVCDLMGYCMLYLVNSNVTSEDIAKFKD